MDKVGQEYDGVINSVMSFGMFVSLENTVEGLVHISNMLDDYYEYHEKELSLVGKSTHKTYTMGDPIKVRLIRADAQQRQVDFEPVLTAEEQERADAEKQRRQEVKRSFSNRRQQNSNTDHKHKYSGNRSNKYERKS